MTQKEMMRAVREAGCTVRVEDGEIRVCVRGGNEAGAYYTNDRDDAVNTARYMVARTTFGPIGTRGKALLSAPPRAWGEMRAEIAAGRTYTLAELQTILGIR